MRDIAPLPDERDHLAAYAALRGLAVGDHTGRGGHDGGAETAEHAREAVLARVHAAPWLRDAFEIGDDPPPVARELQLDDERREGFAGLHAVVLDVALLLEDAGDLLLHAGGRHRGGRVQRAVRVADPGEHVGDGIGEHRSSYQLDFVMPGIAPWCASSRRQIRHTPNFLYTARGRPHFVQRVYSRTL